jgi:hypothetical protein
MTNIFIDFIVPIQLSFRSQRRGYAFAILWLGLSFFYIVSCGQNYKTNPGEGAPTFQREEVERDLDTLLPTAEEEALGFKAYFYRYRETAATEVDSVGLGKRSKLRPLQVVRPRSETYLVPESPLQILAIIAPDSSEGTDSVFKTKISEVCQTHLLAIALYRAKYAKPFRVREKNGGLALYALTPQYDQELSHQTQLWKQFVTIKE